MDSRQFACLTAHSVASEFVRHGLPSPTAEIVGSCVIEDAGVRVVISITRYDGPARLYPTPEGAAVLGVPTMPSLTPLQRSIVDMLNADKPTKLNVIWMRLGRKGNPSGSFRSIVADLVRFGIVKHVLRQGYLRVK